MNPVCTLVWASLLFSPGAYAPGSPTADASYSIKTTDAAPPMELAEPIRKLLAGHCIQLFAGGDKALVEVWFRKEAPGDAIDVQIMNGLTYQEIPETTVLGALRVIGDFTDYRHQKLAPGVYTLRLGFQPVTDDHQGTTPYPEFLLASPAAADLKPDPMEHKALVELSGKTTGKHPSVLLLFPGKNTSDEPKLVEKPGGCWVVMVKQDVRVGDKKTVMGIGLTLIGTSPKAPDKP
ncbi:MAG TPA: hypothetical protein VMS17_14680 [Gemmataceae bacterium]|nr:hypothetical protein [Gemmataceae bacterium]